MGARLSQPRGPAGTTEASIAPKEPPPPTSKNPFPRRINSRTIVAPAAAFTMACLLFIYSRTSIRAAKENARRHREADTGGEGLSLLNEHRRRHGMRERVDHGSGNTLKELASELRSQILGSKREDGNVARGEATAARSEEEERLRALRGKVGRRSGGEGG